MIEKHFTLDPHSAGTGPQGEPGALGELKAMVAAIRNIEQALGDGIKRVSPSELKNRPIGRKSIVAARPIARGERFSAANLTTKRPGTGLSPMRWDELLGREASRSYERDDAIDP